MMAQQPTAGPLVSDELPSTDDNLLAAEIVVADLTAGPPSDASTFDVSMAAAAPERAPRRRQWCSAHACRVWLGGRIARRRESW